MAGHGAGGRHEAYQLNNEALIVQGGSFVACEQGVSFDLGWQGFRSVLAGEGLFWLHLTGAGKMIMNSFGAIYPVEVDGEYIVDTGHIVAFNDGPMSSGKGSQGNWTHAESIRAALQHQS